jgi:hypothetical protein
MIASTPRFRKLSTASVILIGLIAASNAGAQITSPAVGTWASNNNVVSLAPGSAGSLSIATFKSEIESAFIAGNGGTIAFDNYGVVATAQGSIVSSFDGGASTITLSINGSGANTGGPDATNASSGSTYLGFPTNSNARTFTFSEPLSLFGIVGISRGSVRTPSISFLLEDNSTVVLTDSIAITADNTLFNYKASGGNNIVSVTISMPDGFARFDDIGFVTAGAVPEPGAFAAMAGLGALGFAGFRRRAGKR